MSVKPESLENQERDLALQNRSTKGTLTRASVDGAARELLDQLLDRIRAAKAATPRDALRPHCADCYQRGWMAALRSLEE